MSHCGDLGLRVYYECWRVITRQKIREFAVISYDCDMSATSARVLFDISTRCVRSMYDILTTNRYFCTRIYELKARKDDMRRYVYGLCTTYDELCTRIVRVRMQRNDFGYRYILNCTLKEKKEDK